MTETRICNQTPPPRPRPPFFAVFFALQAGIRLPYEARRFQRPCAAAPGVSGGRFEGDEGPRFETVGSGSVDSERVQAVSDERSCSSARNYSRSRTG